MPTEVSGNAAERPRRRRREGSMQPMVMFFMTFILLLGFMLVKVVLIKSLQRAATARAQQVAVMTLTSLSGGGLSHATSKSHPMYPQITTSDIRIAESSVTVRQRVNFPGVAPVSATARAVPARSLPPEVLRGVAPIAMDVDQLPSGEWVSLRDGGITVVGFEGSRHKASDYLPFLMQDANARFMVAPPTLQVGDAVYAERKEARDVFVQDFLSAAGGRPMLVALTRGHRVVGFCRIQIAETDPEKERIRLAPVAAVVPKGIPQIPAGELSAESFQLPPVMGAVLAPQIQT